MERSEMESVVFPVARIDRVGGVRRSGLSISIRRGGPFVDTVVASVGVSVVIVVTALAGLMGLVAVVSEMGVT